MQLTVSDKKEGTTLWKCRKSGIFQKGIYKLKRMFYNEI